MEKVFKIYLITKIICSLIFAGLQFIEVAGEDDFKKLLAIEKVFKIIGECLCVFIFCIMPIIGDCLMIAEIVGMPKQIINSIKKKEKQKIKKQEEKERQKRSLRNKIDSELLTYKYKMPYKYNTYNNIINKLYLLEGNDYHKDAIIELKKSLYELLKQNFSDSTIIENCSNEFIIALEEYEKLLDKILESFKKQENEKKEKQEKFINDYNNKFTNMLKSMQEDMDNNTSIF